MAESRWHLLLLEPDGHLEPAQMHPVTVLEGRARRIVVEQHLELVRSPRVVQERRGEVLALSAEFLRVGWRAQGSPERERTSHLAGVLGHEGVEVTFLLFLIFQDAWNFNRETVKR